LRLFFLGRRMNDYKKCVAISLLFWVVWYVALSSSLPAGVENINISFVRIWQNFSNVALVFDLLFFVFSQVFLLLLLAFFVFLIKESFQVVLGVSSSVGMLVGGISVFLSFSLINSLFYPLSSFSFFVRKGWVDIALLLIFFSVAIILVLASLRSKRVALCSFMLSLFFAFSFIFVPMVESDTPSSAVKSKKPNIIVLGVDALRPSELAYFQGEHDVTPFIDSLLEKSEVYFPSFTPVARTHPAWVSILTGKYPVHTGARFNLTESSAISGRFINDVLRERGYKTIWALDERRFNSINESYGFDEVVGPAMGAADFVITKISDIPPVNVFTNTPIGKYLFPFNYNNRGNYVTYVPYLFNDEILESIGSSDSFFMAAHFCLPHYPFINNLMPLVDLDLDGDVPFTYPRYLSMLSLVDKQIKDLFNKLADRGLLDNTIVYLVSDHGESFSGVDEKLTSGNPYASFEMDAYGHGTNVMSLPQYNVLISKVRFKEGKVYNIPSKNRRLSSLIDIAPDIAKELKIDFDADGFPLSVTSKGRSVFIESSFSPKAVSESRINEIALLQQAMDAYTVNDDGELRMQSSLYDALSEGKQRAIINSQGLLVAVFPDEAQSALVLDTKDAVWWPSVASVPDKLDGWRKALFDLCRFYKDDPTFKHETMCHSTEKVMTKAANDALKFSEQNIK